MENRLDLTPSGMALRAALMQGIEPEVAALRRLDNGRRAADFAVFPLLWAVGAAVSIVGLQAGGLGGWTMAALGVGLSGLALNAIMMLMHQGMHHLLARGRRANRLLTFLCAAPVFMGPHAFFTLHVKHHRHLGGPGDPDEYRNYGRSRRAVWAMHWMRLLVGAYVYMFATAILALQRGTRADRVRIVAEYAILLALWTAPFLLFPLPAVLVAWIVPAILMGHMTAIRAFSQHGLTDVHDPVIASRSLEVRPLTAFFMLHENLHLEHHLFPDVPSYHLPRLHALIWPRLPRVVTARSYSEFLMHFFRRQRSMDESPAGLEVRP